MIKHFFSIRYILGRLWITFLWGKKVKSGPFRGTVLKRNTNLNLFYSKLLGIYEKELHPILSQVLYQNYNQIVIVGTAEGYYFSGFLRHSKCNSIIGFEIDHALRSICDETAKLNNCSKTFKISGACTIEEISSSLTNNDFILMDCEGGELELLKPKCVSQLYGCEILVECHDIFKEGISKSIINRFNSSHSVSKIEARIPTFHDIPFLPKFLLKFLRHTIIGIITERPVGMHWLHLIPKNRL